MYSNWSKWPRGLKHEMSSPAQTLGSWVQTPVEACVYSLFMLSCIGSGLATGWSPVQGVLPTVYKIQIPELINSEWTQAEEVEIYSDSSNVSVGMETYGTGKYAVLVHLVTSCFALLVTHSLYSIHIFLAFVIFKICFTHFILLACLW
jgi:hypothetical protein